MRLDAACSTDTEARARQSIHVVSAAVLHIGGDRRHRVKQNVKYIRSTSPGPAYTVRLVRLWPHQLSAPKWACVTKC